MKWAEGVDARGDYVAGGDVDKQVANADYQRCELRTQSVEQLTHSKGDRRAKSAGQPCVAERNALAGVRVQFRLDFWLFCVGVRHDGLSLLHSCRPWSLVCCPMVERFNPWNRRLDWRCLGIISIGESPLPQQLHSCPPKHRLIFIGD